jgi:hypothetical protein
MLEEAGRRQWCRNHTCARGSVTRSCEICHPEHGRQAVVVAVPVRLPDNGRVRDRSSDRGTGLASFRRYTWWSLAGTTAFVLVVLLGRH